MTKEIRSHETPLTMYKSWSQDSTFRFELRMRITSTIRVSDVNVMNFTENSQHLIDNILNCVFLNKKLEC